MSRYDDVLVPFKRLMETELHANASKGDRPGWLSMTAEQCLLEIYYHVSKLQKAVRDGNGDRIKENTADVANMAMMLADICGTLEMARPLDGALTNEGAEPVACSHQWIDDGQFLLICTECGAQENHDPGWRDMESSPKDGTLVRLLVEFSEHSTEDDQQAPTIGANSFDNTGEDTWRFAGWSWEQDCFTQGEGEPVGWLPLLDTQAPASVVLPEGFMIVERGIWTEEQVESAAKCIELLKDVPGMTARDLAITAMDAGQCKAPDITLSDFTS